MQIKTMMRYHLTPFRMSIIRKTNKQKISIGKDGEKLEHLCAVGRNVK